ncbi:hypothetical protein [Nostoc sp. 'Peltigera membranacea cyanobiont' 232]|uniref:hypothetical protein n=1 Tax=Nostoc sp. 'Peltigera membranacea cyanobiont' 232 TaxID=2014531 RepID=UPI000B956201|nr:hypothetical protein [Nostoc sp. 'Peltigera membranacea cyanobiont' 232]OYE01046.1 hypothetical protein CDG79_31795 [Nostoc sp. 'Peltigera membranacea cyanobiont' 232]
MGYWYEKLVELSEKYCNDTLATASQYLLAKQQNELCIIIALSELQIWEKWQCYKNYDDQEEPDEKSPFVEHIDEKNNECWISKAVLHVEPSIVQNINHEVKKSLKEAIELSMKPGDYGQIHHIHTFSIVAKRVQSNDNWRQELLNLLESGQSLNQGTFIRSEKLVTWEGMRFASMEEMLLAQALEKVKNKINGLKLVYFPNCLARVLADGSRVKIYPDFLICANGKWGILEVDGKQHNLPNQAELDNSRRNRLAKASIQMYSYSAESVREDNGNGAERVVYDFLELLNSVKRS